MTYHYYQNEGGNEDWKPIPEEKLDTIEGAMYVTILGVDTPVPDEPTKEQLADIKYKGPLYFDLDDQASPASTAINAVALIDKLVEKGLDARQIKLWATGGKGFHLVIPEACFLNKPPKTGFAYLYHIYKEMAFALSVESMDFRVYSGRRGRMFRQEHVKRPNGLYKVPLRLRELKALAETAKSNPELAEQEYKELCSDIRDFVAYDPPELAIGLMALFDQCKTKVQNLTRGRKKVKTVMLPKAMPSFDALLRGEGVKPDVGFHQIALQVAITAHARGMGRDELVAAAEGLCANHKSDGGRYNTPAKRKAEIARMWEYTEDNPCYTYAPAALNGILTFNSPDAFGIEATAEEIAMSIKEGVVAKDKEFEHAGLLMSRSGCHAMTETGTKLVTAMSFENVTELLSPETGKISGLEASVLVAGKEVGRSTFDTEQFNSVSGINKVAMSYGQSFSGTDVQARGLYMRMIQQARKKNQRMYILEREGLDVVRMPFHDDQRAREGFMVWADGKGVVQDPKVAELNLNFRFVGFPDRDGMFKTDLSLAPKLTEYLKDSDNKESMRRCMHAAINSQHRGTVGRLLGWMIASHYRMLFHTKYGQFPLLHVNGAAGNGKTQMVKLFSRFHYYYEEPKMLTPTSSLFAVQRGACSSSSVPLILDEFKPQEMRPDVYDRFKLLLRDAYNCREVNKGGGTRDNADVRSVQRDQMSAPMVFIAEAAESESALMERVVLITLVKPPVIQAQEYHRQFKLAHDKAHNFGILGKYISAQIIKRYSAEELFAEFEPLYDAARRELMLQEGEIDTLDNEQLQRKSSAKERTVFNYAVARFGLMKLGNLLQGIFGEEFRQAFEEMDRAVTDSVGDIQAQTVPEWLKVFNVFAHLSQVEEHHSWSLKEGQDYGFCYLDGKNCIEFYMRSCYQKYRYYATAARSKLLFPGEEAFMHALKSLPALVSLNHHGGKLSAPGGSQVFDLNELRMAGFIPPVQTQ